MARRMLDQNTWGDEHFGSLSDKAKILFIACICHADDDGRLSGNLSNLRSAAFRFNDISLKDVESLIFEIAAKMRHFRYYIIDDRKYIQFSKWLEYQHIRADRKKDSKIPPYDNQTSTKCQPSDGIDKVSIDKVSIDSPETKCQPDVNQKDEPSAVSLETLKSLSLQVKAKYDLDTAKCVMAFKNKKKLREVPPYEIVIMTCEEMLASPTEIEDPWPWFSRVLNENLRDHYSGKNIKEHSMAKTVTEVMRKAGDH